MPASFSRRNQRITRDECFRIVQGSGTNGLTRCMCVLCLKTKTRLLESWVNLSSSCRNIPQVRQCSRHGRPDVTCPLVLTGDLTILCRQSAWTRVCSWKTWKISWNSRPDRTVRIYVNLGRNTICVKPSCGDHFDSSGSSRQYLQWRLS